MIRNLISIIIPIYKNVYFLKNSLKSAINQTYKYIEIIVVSDGNNKEDLKKIKNIIKSFKKKIKLLIIKQNSGVSNALNLGIKKSRGDYITWLSHDDFFLKDKLKKQITSIENTNYNICSCDFYYLKFDKIYKKSLPPNYYNNFKISLFLFDKLHGCSLLIKKNCFANVGYFNCKLKHVQDYDMWLRLSKIYDICHISEPLFVSRIHSEQSSKILKTNSEKEKELFYIKYFKKNRNFINNIDLKTIIFFYIINIHRKFYYLNKIFLKRIILKNRNNNLYKILNFINNMFVWKNTYLIDFNSTNLIDFNSIK